MLRIRFFCVPHLSAKSGCFDEYLNVFAVFSVGFVGFLIGFWNLYAMDF